MTIAEELQQYEMDSYENPASQAGRLCIRPHGLKHTVYISNIPASGMVTWLTKPARDHISGVEGLFLVISETEHTQAQPPDDLIEQNSHFLRTLYFLDTCGRDKEAAELALDRLDDLLNAGDFYKCNSILRAADAGNLGDLLIVTLLGTTLAAKSELTARKSFFNSAYRIVSERRGGDGAAKLLNKYR